MDEEAFRAVCSWGTALTSNCFFWDSITSTNQRIRRIAGKAIASKNTGTKLPRHNSAFGDALGLEVSSNILGKPGGKEVDIRLQTGCG